MSALLLRCLTQKSIPKSFSTHPTVDSYVDVFFFVFSCVEPSLISRLTWQLSKDFEQAKLEDEMNKRRERVEKWRLEQKKKMEASKPTENDEAEEPRKVWSLEDDDDDDEGAFFLNWPPLCV